MATLVRFFSGPWLDFELPSLPRVSIIPKLPTSENIERDTVARRQFIDEMLSRNSDAFATDMDVMGLMSIYPDRF